MHPNNAKAAVKFWEMVDGGTSLVEATNKFQYVNGGEWHNYEANGSTVVAPLFAGDYEIREKPVHWDLMQEYERYVKDDPEEWRNWELLRENNTEWCRCVHTPSWLETNQYRRKPLPKPDANGWYTIDSVPIGEIVDLYDSHGDSLSVICAKVSVVNKLSSTRYDVTFSFDGSSWSIYATHWRPATKLPACHYEKK